MRTDRQYLTDMVEAAEAIARYIGDLTREAFLQDDLRQSAVMQKLGVIGEAAGKISPALQAHIRQLSGRKLSACGISSFIPTSPSS